MRKIKKAKISFISLCPRGMNQMPVLFKDDGSFRMDTLIKGDPVEGELTAVVYVPDRPDKEGDFASREVIKEMAYEYVRDHRKLDLRHDGKALKPEQAFVAQNFIIQKGDPRFTDLRDYDGNPVDPEGGWGMVIKVDDPQLQKLYKDGEWNGVSMFGTATEVETSKESTEGKGVLQKIMDLLRGTSKNHQEEPDMEENVKKELDALKNDMGELTKLVKGMAEERVAEKEAAEKAKLEKAEADQKAELEKLQKENKELSEELSKLKKASNQSTEDEDQDLEDLGISKEEADQIKIGEEIAKSLYRDETED